MTKKEERKIKREKEGKEIKKIREREREGERGQASGIFTARDQVSRKPPLCGGALPCFLAQPSPPSPSLSSIPIFPSLPIAPLQRFHLSSLSLEAQTLSIYIALLSSVHPSQNQTPRSAPERRSDKKDGGRAPVPGPAPLREQLRLLRQPRDAGFLLQVLPRPPAQGAAVLQRQARFQPDPVLLLLLLAVLLLLLLLLLLDRRAAGRGRRL